MRHWKLCRCVWAAVHVPTPPIWPAPWLLSCSHPQKRQPFNPIAFLKTPYGMMGAFMLFSIFIMPKLKVDPEEYKVGAGAGCEWGKVW